MHTFNLVGFIISWPILLLLGREEDALKNIFSVVNTDFPLLSDTVVKNANDGDAWLCVAAIIITVTIIENT